MSRSYKKNPFVKEKNKRYWKRQANRRVRKTNCANGGFYKKLYNSWNITDWRFRLKEDKKSMSK